MEAHQAAIIEIPEQSDRTGSRGIKSRTGPMLGFKNFDCAATTIAHIEQLRCIRRGQFALGRLRLNNQTAPAIWNAVLAA
jgi:transposase-like protein